MKIHAVVLIAVIALLSITSEASVYGGQVVTQTKNVSHKTKVTTKNVSHKTKRGTKNLYAKTASKTRPARNKTWHTGRKVVSRTKKIVS